MYSHERSPEAVLLEGGILCLAGGVLAAQLVEQGLTQHAVTLTVDEDDTLFALLAVLVHHLAEAVKLVIEYLAVAHPTRIIKQFGGMKVNLQDVVATASLLPLAVGTIATLR